MVKVGMKWNSIFQMHVTDLIVEIKIKKIKPMLSFFSYFIK